MSTARIVLHPAHVEGTEKVRRSQRPHYLTLVAANGETLATSEVYANRSSARRGASDWVAAFHQVADEVEFNDAPFCVDEAAAQMKAER